MKKFYPDDAVLIGFHPETKQLIVRSVRVDPPDGKEDAVAKRREETKEKYSGKHGKKYAIMFYSMGDRTLEITDFFRACLIDANFYVKNLFFKSGQMVAVAEEFTLNENWDSEADKDTDEGLYRRLVELTDLFWHEACDLTPQATKEAFEKLTKTGN